MRQPVHPLEVAYRFVVVWPRQPTSSITGGDIVTRNDSLQKSLETVKLADLAILDKNPLKARRRVDES
jgi:hypothetical protein